MACNLQSVSLSRLVSEASAWMRPGNVITAIDVQQFRKSFLIVCPAGDLLL